MALIFSKRKLISLALECASLSKSPRIAHPKGNWSVCLSSYPFYAPKSRAKHKNNNKEQWELSVRVWLSSWSRNNYYKSVLNRHCRDRSSECMKSWVVQTLPNQQNHWIIPTANKVIHKAEKQYIVSPKCTQGDQPKWIRSSMNCLED